MRSDPAGGQPRGLAPACRPLLWIGILAVLCLGPGLAASGEGPGGERFIAWGGHLRLSGAASRPDDRSLYQAAGTGTYLDGAGEFRLKNQLFFGDWGSLETHYEAVLAGGETWRKGSAVAASVGRDFAGGLFSPALRPISDDRRLMDLTHVIDEGPDGAFYHRLDRLFLTVDRPRGNLRLGRQAVTWGSGMLFNPMDLFNPFAPTDVVRDYKVGDDMALALLPVGENGDLQVIGVPRRNPQDGAVEWRESAAGAKLRLPAGTTEWTLLLAENHDTTVAGAGAVGYLGEAAWRVDVTYTRLPKESPSGGYLSAVANMDLSWTWWEKNVYGFMELYWNGLGETDYENLPENTDLLSALARGEVFTLGRLYVAPHLSVELHPLFTLAVSGITNLLDPSGIVQPRFVWNIAQDIEAMAGLNLYWGGAGTEYGGFDLPGTAFRAAPADSVYAWLTWYY